jgi:hypothetical protein
MAVWPVRRPVPKPRSTQLSAGLCGEPEMRIHAGYFGFRWTQTSK